MGESLDRGQVLVLSMWDDHDAGMLWLDSNYPLDKDPSTPGVNRGPCPEDSGDPVDMEENYPDATVKYYNVKFGTIGSTYHGGRKNLNCDYFFIYNICKELERQLPPQRSPLRRSESSIIYIIIFRVKINVDIYIETRNGVRIFKKWALGMSIFTPKLTQTP
jgi:hypothetical protein